MVTVIDYGLGNLRSVAGAVKKLGYDVVLSSKAEDIIHAEKLILPGVGAFGDGMRNILNMGLKEILDEQVLSAKKPILGICLGSQLMAKEGFEFGNHKGLGWVDGKVVKLGIEECGLKVPHVGWNNLIRLKEDTLLKDIPNDGLFYYVHSYHMETDDRDMVIAECEYGKRFTAAFHKENIYATQFHPEKSQLSGLKVLENFLKRV